MNPAPTSNDRSEHARSLRGAVALVTGASGGIGRAVATLLASSGARVVVSGRRAAALDDLCRDIADAGGAATAVLADLRDAEAPARLVEAAVAWGGGLDALVSCAGGARFTRFGRISREQFDADMRVNLLAPVDLARAALPHLARRGRGRIVFVGSIAAREPAPPRGTAYLAAKAGLVHFAESLFAEIRDEGVAVSSILPDLTDTPMVPDSLGYDRASLIAPASVAEAVRFVMTCPPDACVTELHLRPQPSLRRIAG